jgi:hypothetical protein
VGDADEVDADEKRFRMESLAGAERERGGDCLE